MLDFLVKNEALAEELRARMLAWRHGGFSPHNEVCVGAEDAEGRKTLAGYMLRAPMSLQKMTYDAATGTVIYRARMHAGLKRHRLSCRTESHASKQPRGGTALALLWRWG